MAEPQDVLGEGVAKLLSDKLYDKRKQASIEIESKVKEAISRGPPGQVQRILDCLRLDYIKSPHTNHRKGGLIGLASIAIGLDTEVSQFLSQLVREALELFKDEDPRVRYYACEALYNISKVAGESALAHLNEVFDGLCKLYADVDTDVKTGANLLDRLMKDIVTQSPSKLSVAKFVPLLEQRMKFRNPYIRQLVLAWIGLLLKVPDVDMVRYLPLYLEGLFNMLGDQSRDIRHNADACLDALKKHVTSSTHKRALQSISECSPIVVKACFVTDECARLTALCWLHEFIHLQMQMTSHINGRPAESWVEILPDLLSGTLHCIDDKADEIARMAVEMNNGLLEMVQTLEHDIPVDRLVDNLLQSMKERESMVVRTACLQWICMLLAQRQAQMLQRGTLDRLFTPIFDTLLHPDDEVVAAALTVLAQVMEGRSPARDDAPDGEACEDLFTVVTHRLLRLFAESRQMLETRGRLMIRQLCGHLNPRKLYVTVARAISQETDIDFAQQLVQTFSWILLTATETKSVREELLLASVPDSQVEGRRSNAGHSRNESSGGAIGGAGGGVGVAMGATGATPLFLELLEPWFHNPVSALALCLWAGQYELASELTGRLAAFEPTLDLLKQLDQLVHLLESPVFSRLRLNLLEPRRHPDLLKCLLGIAMLLPQAGAFGILRERIHIVQSGLLLEARREDEHGAGASGGGGGSAPGPGHGNGLLWWSQAPRGDGQAAGGGGGGGGGTNLAALLERFDAVTAAAQA